MKAVHAGLLAAGAALAGGLAVWMTTPPPPPVPAVVPALKPVAPAPTTHVPTPHVQVAAEAPPPILRPRKPSPAPLPAPVIAAAPPPVYVQPPVYADPPHREVARPRPTPAPAVIAAADKPSPVPYQKPETVAPARGPEPPAELPLHQATLERGQDLAVRILHTLSVDSAQRGDVFQGELAEPLVAGGFVIGEKGTPVTGRVVDVQKGNFLGSGAGITLRLLNFVTADGQKKEISTDPWNLRAVSAGTVIRFHLAARITITEKKL